MERIAEVMAPDALHQGVRTLLEDAEKADRADRAKLLLTRIARRHEEQDVALLDELAHRKELDSGIRRHAVGLLLGLGYPHALRVSPEALEDFRSSGRVPAVSLTILGLYGLGELIPLIYVASIGWVGSVQAWPFFVVLGGHLALWGVPVLGAVLFPPTSRRRRWARSALRVVCGLHAILAIGMFVSSVTQAWVMAGALLAGAVMLPVIAGLSVARATGAPVETSLELDEPAGAGPRAG